MYTFDWKKIANSEIKNINNTQTSNGVLGVHRPIYVPYKQIKENNSTIWSCSTGLPIFLQVHWKREKERGEIHVVVKGPFTTFPPLFLSSQKRLFLINECPSKRLGPFRRAEKNNIEFSPWHHHMRVNNMPIIYK